MCGFATVTSNPDSFVLMGGDGCHHAGELRPSLYQPLPEKIDGCGGQTFVKLLPDGYRTRLFFEPARDGQHYALYDMDQAKETIGKIQGLDAADSVLVALAHDASLLGVVDFFPKQMNGFMEKGWKEKCRWRFLGDFASAVGTCHFN